MIGLVRNGPTAVRLMSQLAATAILAIPIMTGCRPDAAQFGQIRAAQARGRIADDVRLRRLWSGTGFLNGFYASSPSPDGRYGTQTDWSTLDLAVRDLVTGVHRVLEGLAGAGIPHADLAEARR